MAFKFERIIEALARHTIANCPVCRAARKDPPEGTPMGPAAAKRLARGEWNKDYVCDACEELQKVVDSVGG